MAGINLQQTERLSHLLQLCILLSPELLKDGRGFPGKRELEPHQSIVFACELRE